MPSWASGIWSGKPAARAGRLLGLLGGALSLVSCAGPSDGLRRPAASQVRRAVERGVAFLQRDQDATGAFRVFVRYEPAPGAVEAPGAWIPDPCTQGTSYVLYSLQFVRDQRAAAMAQSAAEFLLREMEPPGVWRYYAASHRLHRTWALDIEDTALAGLALLAHGIAFPHQVTNLLRYQTAAGGFRLWLFGPDEPPSEAAASRDPLLRIPREWYSRYALADDTTNSLVLAYFARHGQPLPTLCGQLTRLVERGADPVAVQTDHFHFPTPYLFPYAAGKAYRAGAGCLEPALAPLIARLHAAQRPDGSWGGPSDTALVLAALLDFGDAGPAVERGLTSLLAQQQPDGGWPMQVTQRMPLEQRTAVYASRAMVTGVALEALEKYAGTRRGR